MSTEQVEKIAQGRVWLGTDAKKIKLIDGFGGLSDAINEGCNVLGFGFMDKEELGERLVQAWQKKYGA